MKYFSSPVLMLTLTDFEDDNLGVDELDCDVSAKVISGGC